MELSVTPWTAACQAPMSSLSPRVCSNSCPLNQWCYLTILSSVSLFSFFLQPIQHHSLSQWVSSSHQVAKVLDFSFSISPSNEYSGLISFKIDWFDLLAVQVEGELASYLLKSSFSPKRQGWGIFNTDFYLLPFSSSSGVSLVHTQLVYECIKYYFRSKLVYK